MPAIWFSWCWSEHFSHANINTGDWLSPPCQYNVAGHRIHSPGYPAGDMWSRTQHCVISVTTAPGLFEWIVAVGTGLIGAARSGGIA